MKTTPPDPTPDWKWGTAEGSRELDRIRDRQMTFREKLEWLEESEALALRLQASMKDRIASEQDGTDRGTR